MNAVEKAVDEWYRDGEQVMETIKYNSLVKKMNAIAIPKDVLREKIDKIFIFMTDDISDTHKVTISKDRLLKDLLGEVEE